MYLCYLQNTEQYQINYMGTLKLHNTRHITKHVTKSTEFYNLFERIRSLCDDIILTITIKIT